MPISKTTKIDPTLSRPASETVQWDDHVPQLGLRRRKQCETWIVQWRIDGRSRKQTLGTATGLQLEDARRLALDILSPIPKLSTATPTLTVGAFIDRYLLDHAPSWKPSTLKSNRHSATLYIFPLLKLQKVAALVQEDVVDWLASLGCAAGSKNRALAVLSGMMRHAEILGIRPPESNPCKGLRKSKSVFKAHYLTLAEWRRLGAALRVSDSAHPRAVGAIRFLAYSGARRGEAMGLKWVMIDGHRVALNDTKTGPRAIWLGKPVKRLLAAFSKSNQHVFGKGDEPLSEAALSKVWHDVRVAANLPRLRLQDLRHSFASVAINSGQDLRLVAGLLGHADLKTTEGYAHLDVQTVKDASQRVGKHFEKILRPRTQPTESPCPFERFRLSRKNLVAFCQANDLDEVRFRTDLIARRQMQQHGGATK